MTVDSRPSVSTFTCQVVIRGTEHWDAEVVSHLRKRMEHLAEHAHHHLQEMRVTLKHNSCHDAQHAYVATARMTVRGRVLYAHAEGATEVDVVPELEERVRVTLDREKQRRWWARYRHGVERHQLRNRDR